MVRRAGALVGGQNYFERFPFAGVFVGNERSRRACFAADMAAAVSLEHQLMAAAIAAGLLGLFLAWLMYIKRPDQPKKLAQIV